MSIGRLIRAVVIGWVVGMIGGMIAALTVKRSLDPTTDQAADEVELAAIFGPLSYHSTAAAFRGGLLEAWYGGGILDLRDATLAPEGATLRVRAVFGGVQILVPSDWRVVSRVRGLGGLSDVREVKGEAVDAPELVIEGVMVAAGIAVQSEVDADIAEWVDKADKVGVMAAGQDGISGWSQRNQIGLDRIFKRDGAGADAGEAVSEAVTDAADVVEGAAESASDTVTDAAASLADDATEAVSEAASDATEMAPTT